MRVGPCERGGAREGSGERAVSDEIGEVFCPGTVSERHAGIHTIV